MDCKADRKEAVLHIYNIVLESHLAKVDVFALALHEELLGFLAFNNCRDFVLHKSVPFGFKLIFESL